MGAFLAGIVVMLIIGMMFIPSPEEILKREGCEVVTVETKLRRLEILSQGLEADLIFIQSDLEKLKLIQADLEIVRDQLTDIQLSGK